MNREDMEAANAKLEARKQHGSAADAYVPEDLSDQARGNAPDATDAFGRAAANEERPDIGAEAREQVNARQVEETAPAPRVKPPPGLDEAGARDKHTADMARDDGAARADQLQADKAEFDNRSQPDAEHELDRNDHDRDRDE